MNKVSKWILFVVPVLIACVQLYFSNFSNLTRWKGGGFGMYTDIHIYHRTVWIVAESADSTKKIKIHPVEKPWAPDNPLVAKLRKELSPFMDGLVSFPSSVDYNAPEFKEVKTLINFPNASKYSILIGQLVVDIDHDKIQHKLLCSHDI